MKHNFRSIKDRTLDAVLPPNAAPERVGLVAAGAALSAIDKARPRKGNI
jgi:hypothetical protein